MDRTRALALVGEHLANANLRKHSLAVAACMKRLAPRFSADPLRWELAGLLHDLDYETTVKEPERHGLVTRELLVAEGYDDEDGLNAILAHAERVQPVTEFQVAMTAVDPTTGFLVACALMHPERSLAALDVPFAVRRFGEKRFAAGASRETMRLCEKLGFTVEEFLGECLAAMREVSDELGL